MTESLLTLVREKQAEATREALNHYRERGLPKPRQARTRLASDLSQLIAQHAANRADDEEMVQRLIREARSCPSEQVDRINSFLQRYLALIVDLSRILRGLAAKLMKAGYPVQGVASLDAMIAERERWREDLPEQLALASRQVRAMFEKRVKQALRTPPQDTDWRSLFK